MPTFLRYVGVDYSGAQTPRASLPGLRVCMAEGDGLPMEVPPPPSPRKYWTRRGMVSGFSAPERSMATILPSSHGGTGRGPATQATGRIPAIYLSHLQKY